MRNGLTNLRAHPFAALLLMSAIFIAAYVSQVLLTVQAKVPTSTWLMPVLPPLAVGDWVFRSGTAQESYVIQTLSKSEYSHLGIIVSLEPQTLIVHATTNDDAQRPDQVIISTLNDFIHPALAQHYAIVRPNFINTAQHQAAAQWLIQQVGRPFVLTARDNPHLYCTTLVADAIQQITADFQPRWQTITAPLFTGEYLFPQAFAEYPDLTWLYRSVNEDTVF